MDHLGFIALWLDRWTQSIIESTIQFILLFPIVSYFWSIGLVYVFILINVNLCYIIESVFSFDLHEHFWFGVQIDIVWFIRIGCVILIEFGYWRWIDWVDQFGIIWFITASGISSNPFITAYYVFGIGFWVLCHSFTFVFNVPWCASTSAFSTPSDTFSSGFVVTGLSD